jgi:hypothetical protein
MAKKYSIKIKLIQDVVITEKPYQVIADTGNEKDNGKVYAYVPREVTRKEESEIFSMELDDLDLKKVVTALIIQ